MSCLWECLRKRINKHNLNEIEGVALLSADHSIITLDANEDDWMEARGMTADIQKIQNILFSDAGALMDEDFKQNLKDYLETKTRIITEQNIMDSIDINTKEVAQDIIRKYEIEQHKTEIEHLLKSVNDPSQIKQPKSIKGDIFPESRENSDVVDNINECNMKAPESSRDNNPSCQKAVVLI